MRCTISLMVGLLISKTLSLCLRVLLRTIVITGESRNQLTSSFVCRLYLNAVFLKSAALL